MQQNLPENFIKRFVKPMQALSNAPCNGGLFKAHGFFFIKVEKNYNLDYKKDCTEFEKIIEQNFVGFMTAVEINKVISYAKYGNVESYVTAGLTNPAVSGNKVNRNFGTINIVVIIYDDLTIGGLANVIMTVTEAKAYTLLKKGYNATGTTSDGIGVFSYDGAKEWAGTATEVGYRIGKVVRLSLKNSIEKWEKLGSK